MANQQPVKQSLRDRLAQLWKSRRSNQDQASSQASSSRLQSSYQTLKVATVEHHRQRIIRQAQKYRLNFINTNQRVVLVSVSIVVLAILLFASFIYWRLYRSQDYSNFAYNVTQILPLPVARAGSSFVAYEDYLRELRRQVHYFETQQQLDFSQPETAQNLVTLPELRNAALQRTVALTYIKELARQHDIPIPSDVEIEARLNDFRQQGGISQPIDDLEVVLQNFWGLSLNEYKQVLSDVILQERVVRYFDVELGNNAQERMEEIRSQLNIGTDFGSLAREFSEDINTASNGGEYNFLFTSNAQQEDPAVLRAIFETEVGEISDIIDTGDRLELVKVLEDQGNGLRRAAHISIFYIPLSDVLKEIENENPVSVYIDDVEYVKGVAY